MTNYSLLSFILVILGSIIMSINIKMYSKIYKNLNLIPDKKRNFINIRYKIHLTLMYFFLAGYLFVGFDIISSYNTISLIFTGFIFFFGAIFVFIGIVIQSKMLNLLNETYLQTIRALTNAIEARDKYTMGHSQHVANLSILIYKNVLQTNDTDMIEYAALLHDIGKIGIPENILNKPDKLDDYEFDIIKTHAKLGSQIIKNIEGLNEISEWVLYHHERIDGNGYYNLPFENIPLESKIISIADTFSALVTSRPYRKGMDYDKAIEIIKKHSGTQLDPHIVSVFINLPIDEIKNCMPTNLQQII